MPPSCRDDFGWKNVELLAASDVNGRMEEAEKARAELDVITFARNWLVPVTLLTLRECTFYGYKLMEQMTKFGFEAMNPGTFYRTLRQMENDGLCQSEWDTSSGAGSTRRVCSITDAGEAYLDFWAEALEQYRRNMDAFFRLYTGRSPVGMGRQKEDK